MSQDDRRTLMLEYRFPLRPDEPKKNPYLCLPNNLTHEEVARLRQMLESLVLPGERTTP